VLKGIWCWIYHRYGNAISDIFLHSSHVCIHNRWSTGIASCTVRRSWVNTKIPYYGSITSIAHCWLSIDVGVCSTGCNRIRNWVVKNLAWLSFKILTSIFLGRCTCVVVGAGKCLLVRIRDCESLVSFYGSVWLHTCHRCIRKTSTVARARVKWWTKLLRVRPSELSRWCCYSFKIRRFFDCYRVMLLFNTRILIEGSSFCGRQIWKQIVAHDSCILGIRVVFIYPGVYFIEVL